MAINIQYGMRLNNLQLIYIIIILHLNMILKNITNMTQGYFFLGLGKYYIDESINLLKTIKKFDTKRRRLPIY